jgi:hypothetical protein
MLFIRRYRKMKKAAFLKNLLEENKEIISISPEKPTLEEIFYKV